MSNYGISWAIKMAISFHDTSKDSISPDNWSQNKIVIHITKREQFCTRYSYILGLRASKTYVNSDGYTSSSCVPSKLTDWRWLLSTDSTQASLVHGTDRCGRNFNFNIWDSWIPELNSCSFFCMGKIIRMSHTIHISKLKHKYKWIVPLVSHASFSSTAILPVHAQIYAATVSFQQFCKNMITNTREMSETNIRDTSILSYTNLFPTLYKQ